MAGGVLDHVDEHPAHRHGVAPPCRPGVRHCQFLDSAVGGSASPLVIPEDVRSGLLWRDVHYGVVIRIVEGDRLERTPECLAEPHVLAGGQVLHQAQQVRARWRHRPAQPFIVQAIDFPQHSIAMPLKADAKTLFLAAGQHSELPHARTLVTSSDGRNRSAPGWPGSSGCKCPRAVTQTVGGGGDRRGGLAWSSSRASRGPVPPVPRRGLPGSEGFGPPLTHWFPSARITGWYLTASMTSSWRAEARPAR